MSVSLFGGLKAYIGIKARKAAERFCRGSVRGGRKRLPKTEKFLGERMIVSRRNFIGSLLFFGLSNVMGVRSMAHAGTIDFKSDADKILIAFFSRADENYGVGVVEKGNTQVLAEMIHAELGGDLFHIRPAEKYPFGYDECVELARKELRQKARPALAENLSSIDRYKYIFLGFPNWWSDMPMPVYTFLERFTYENKTVIPFCTHEGSGMSGIEQKIRNICKGASFCRGLAMKGTVAQNSGDRALAEVRQWLSSL